MPRIKKIPFQQKAKRYRVNNAFLASARASGITGVLMPVNAGYLCK
ncbi:MAG: hypothetical protein HZR80_20260 [Candidatus Heimdallarchaeota archaeon]